MAVVKLKPQPEYPFTYAITLGVRDINYGGHLGNDALVTLLQEARVRLLHALGAGELDLGDGKTGIIMNELAVSYRAEGRLLDEVIVHSAITHIKTASFRVCHLVTREEETIALAEVGIVTFDYAEKCIAPIPEEFRAKIA